MSNQYQKWKEYTMDLCKDEYTKISCKILGEPLYKPEEVNEKSYMEYLEYKIDDLEYENNKLKIRYVDFKNLKKENDTLKNEIEKLKSNII